MHSSLHDPLPSYAINSPALDGFASSYSRTDPDHYIRPLTALQRGEDAWSKNLGEYRVAPSYSTLGLGLNPVLNNQSSVPPMTTSYDSGYPYPSHASSDMSSARHHGFSGQLSPPPTASTSTSSGSSSPSLQGDFYDRGVGRSSYVLPPNIYGSLPYHSKPFSGSDWQTCDPRGVSVVHGMLPPLPTHSPVGSDSSNSADGKKPRIRPRRVDSTSGGYEVGLAKSMIIGPTPTVEMMYRVKKKVTASPPQPVLGMGLEDIDENEVCFPSGRSSYIIYFNASNK